MTSNDAAYQIRTHLLYELKWMIYAAVEFQSGKNPAYVALIDSASVHARNLLEFARRPARDGFTLSAIGGTPESNRKWEDFLNNRVTHMSEREEKRPAWPSGLDNERTDRLVVMASDILSILEANGPVSGDDEIIRAYNAVVLAARAYLTTPSEATHKALAATYDSSRDGRSYADGPQSHSSTGPSAGR